MTAMQEQLDSMKTATGVALENKVSQYIRVQYVAICLPVIILSNLQSTPFQLTAMQDNLETAIAASLEDKVSQYWYVVSVSVRKIVSNKNLLLVVELRKYMESRCGESEERIHNSRQGD